ncbi:MAG: sigma-70 family RNA polymerase sigma factor [Clostridia bacterium]|nr:sigma-70 family RNA polymerase sigma factor [Clostridia bacterium]MBQ1260259.1 sigma-70 family RNA polymerase sigma factor [Clostridia bacterium]
MDDRTIINLFFDRSEDAIKELDIKYGKCCHELSYSIVGNRQDAEECVNDSYLGVWNAIPPKRPNPLLAFVCKIVRNISINRFNANKAKKRNTEYDISLEELGDIIEDPNTLESEYAEKEILGYIEEFLDMQTQENRVIFIRRYWFSDSLADIGKYTSMSKKAVAARLKRMREKLKVYLEERGITV